MLSSSSPEVRVDQLYSDKTVAAAAVSCAVIALIVGFAAGLFCSAFVRRRRSKAGQENGEALKARMNNQSELQQRYE